MFSDTEKVKAKNLGGKVVKTDWHKMDNKYLNLQQKTA